MAANLTTTYASQILDLLGLSKFKGGGIAPPAPPPPIKISLPHDTSIKSTHGRVPFKHYVARLYLAALC